MPRYDYECLECAERFDVFIAMKDKNENCEVQCPECKSKKTAQSFGNGAITNSGPLILTPDTARLTGKRMSGLETRPGYKKFY